MSRASRAMIGQGIGKGFASAGEYFAKNIGKKIEKQRDEEIFTQLQNPELTPLQRAQLVAKLSKNGQTSLVTTMRISDRLRRERDVEDRHDRDFQYKSDREERLKNKEARQELTAIYNNKLKDIKDDLKDPYLLKKDQLDMLKQQKKDIQNELQVNLNRLRKGQRLESKFFDLNGQEEQMAAQVAPGPIDNQMGVMPQEAQQPVQPPMQQPVPQQMAAPQGQSQVAPPQPPPTAAKIPWDKSNPEHIAFAQEAQKASGGDKNIANSLIAERFQMVK